MNELISVSYFKNSFTKDNSIEYFAKTKKKEATAFAKTISKETGRRASVWKCKGYYNGSKFCEVESSNIAVYVDGKKC